VSLPREPFPILRRSLRSGWPDLDYTGTAKHAAIDFLDVTIIYPQRSALNPDRRIGQWVAHQRD
jgi:hypothetical protein